MTTPAIQCPKLLSEEEPYLCDVKPINDLTPVHGSVKDAHGYSGYAGLFYVDAGNEVGAPVLIITRTPEVLGAVSWDHLGISLDKKRMRNVTVFPTEKVTPTVAPILDDAYPRTPRQRD